MPPRAVLFDFDGVLADTENVHIAAWQRTLAAIGWEVADDVCARATEEDDRLFLTRLFEERKVSGGNVEGWVRKKQELTRAMLADAPRVYPGVKPLVDRLCGKVTLGVVSTTWRENVEAVLEHAGLRRAFDLILAKEDVRKPKPDPEGYRRAVESLSLQAGQVVVLEDSPTGLSSARAAGVPVVAVGHRRPAGDWTEGAPYLADLRDTARVLSALGIDEPAVD